MYSVYVVFILELLVQHPSYSLGPSFPLTPSLLSFPNPRWYSFAQNMSTWQGDILVYAILLHNAKLKFCLYTTLFLQEVITSPMNGVGAQFTVKGLVSVTCLQLQ